MEGKWNVNKSEEEWFGFYCIVVFVFLFGIWLFYVWKVLWFEILFICLMGNFYWEFDVNLGLFFWFYFRVFNNNFGISGVYDYLN